jgi:hypothetical protein
MKKQSVLKIIHLTKLTMAVSVLIQTSGCLVATQSLNHGKLLNPGERLITTGYGWKHSAKYFSTYHHDSTANIDIIDSTRMGWLNFIFDYRIGILRKYPFGRGLEIGYHLEYAQRKEREKIVPFSPPLLEIDTRFGLPDFTLHKSIFHHNVNAGWDVGQWVDNGWFLGYAAGWEFNMTIPYISLRYFSTATDLINRGDLSENTFTKHEKTRGVRLCGGISLKMPANHNFIPEYITPEVSLIFPNFNKTQPIGFSFTLGIRWIPGY